MKNNLAHHVKRLASRLLQAEMCEDPSKVDHILHKAKKHRKALKKLKDQQSEANPYQLD